MLAAERRSVLLLILLVLLFGGAGRWWAMRHDDAIGRAMQAVARDGDIRLLSSETCVYCAEARGWLSRREVPFEECFVERDTACARRWQDLAMPGTPVVLVRGQPQLGFDPERILRALESG